MTEQVTKRSGYQGPALFSYGFRPFFLGAALFASVALPAWILLLTRGGDSEFLSTAREGHVHEMVFGFLPAVITGFLLTAIPNWTGRLPIRGHELMLLFTVWLAGRLVAFRFSCLCCPPPLKQPFLSWWRGLFGGRRSREDLVPYADRAADQSVCRRQHFVPRAGS